MQRKELFFWEEGKSLVLCGRRPTQQQADDDTERTAECVRFFFLWIFFVCSFGVSRVFRSPRKLPAFGLEFSFVTLAFRWVCWGGQCSSFLSRRMGYENMNKSIGICRKQQLEVS